MKEFMLLIRNRIDHQSAWKPEQHEQFLKKCESYIEGLKKDGKLISAQPLVREGKIITGKTGSWKEAPFNETEEVQVGYYHILANDMDEAIEIAKKNPEFEFGTTARIEVRPIKTKEKTTGFVYPTTLSKPTLGNVTAITISTSDLERSLSFYKQLGFNEVFRADFPVSIIQITDGALLIMLRKDDKPYIALTYYVKDVEKKAVDLESEGIVFKVKPNASDMIKRYVMKSPDGLSVSLVTFVEGFMQPTGQTLLTMPPQDYAHPEKYVNKVCGLFGEFAHPVKDIDASMVFWGKLGFKILSKKTSPYPWAIISDGLSIVGLHQTTNFTDPTITFFAVDMKDKIEKLKKIGLEDLKEKDGLSNVVLTTPEKQHINLFKLGM